MSHIRWKGILDSVGLVAIVASLIFVAIEVRQSNQIGRLDAMQSMASDWSSVGIELAGNRNLAALLAKTDSGAVPKDFDEVENRQLFNILHGLDHHWEMRFKMSNLGVLEASDYSFPESGSSSFGSAYHKEIWPRLRPGFSEEFAVFWEHQLGLVEP